MRHRRGIHRTRSAILPRLFGLVVLGILAFVFHLWFFGFPDWLSEPILGRMNRRTSFVVDARRLRLDMKGGIAAEGVRVYRKGVVGPPAAEAERVVLVLDPAAALERRAWIKRVEVSSGIGRPQLSILRDGSEPRACSFRVDMQLDVSDCVVQGVLCERFTCRMSGVGPVLAFEDIVARVSNEGMRGKLEGEISYDTHGRLLTGAMSAQMDPRLPMPVYRAWNLHAVSELVGRFAFIGAPPRVETKFRQHMRGERTLVAAARFWLADCSYLDIPCLRADGDAALQVSRGSADVDIRPLLVVRNEGTVSGGFRVDTRQGTVNFDGESTIEPKALGRMLGVFSEEFLAICQFEGKTRISGAGRVDYKELVGTDFTGHVFGRGIGLWGFVTEECSFDVSMQGRTNTLSGISGRIYGGELRANAQVVLPASETNWLHYTVAGGLDGADFRKLAEDLMSEGYEKYSGKLELRVNVSGDVDQRPDLSARGSGKVRIRNGRVFMLPIFGGFSGYMTKVIPGLDFVLRQTDATARYEIADGKAHADKVAIEGDVLSLSAVGDYYFDRRVDYYAQVRLLRENFVGKVVRLPTWIFSKLFEFRLRGTIVEPRWYLVNFSSDLLQRLGLRSEKELSIGVAEDQVPEIDLDKIHSVKQEDDSPRRRE